MELFPIQRILGLGKCGSNNHPQNNTATVSHMGWLAAAICCQVYKDSFATAPVLASCIYYSIVEDDDTCISLLGYNPYTNLNDLQKTVVKYCVSQARLHDLDFQVSTGNYYCIPALRKEQEIMAGLNDEIKRLCEESQEAAKEAKPPLNGKTKKTVH